MDEVNWAQIERDIEEAMLPGTIDLFLRIEEIKRRVGSVHEEYRIFDIHAQAASEAIASFAKAWNSGPAWN